MSLWQDAVRRRGYFLFSAVLLVLDQLTKVLAHAFLRGQRNLEIIPGLFDLSYSRNPGGLFGSFSQWTSPWRILLLTVLPVLAILWIARALAKSDGLDRLTRCGLALILGGAVGNLLDRVVRGEVIDFLDVYASSPGFADWLIRTFGTAHWPTFNVADSSIVVGAGLLLAAILAPRSHEPAASDPSATALQR